jgi:hypothetical protein
LSRSLREKRKVLRISFALNISPDSHATDHYSDGIQNDGQCISVAITATVEEC